MAIEIYHPSNPSILYHGPNPHCYLLFSVGLCCFMTEFLSIPLADLDHYVPQLDANGDLHPEPSIPSSETINMNYYHTWL